LKTATFIDGDLSVIACSQCEVVFQHCRRQESINGNTAG
jgi:hypothetical protein